MISIESTAEGREGYFYQFCQEAEQLRKSGKKLTPLDFKIFFFPWWIDSRYVLDGEVTVTEDDQKYFSMLKQKYNIELNEKQKSWYIKKKALNKAKMFQEYPSTLEEAFQKDMEGAYYSAEMSKVYLNNRIGTVPHDPRYAVQTYWDLSMNDFNIILFVQQVGPQIRFIDLYYNSGEGLAHYKNEMDKRREDIGYRYGTHYFPHDVS